jgi:hypothetical protein
MHLQQPVQTLLLHTADRLASLSSITLFKCNILRSARGEYPEIEKRLYKFDAIFSTLLIEAEISDKNIVFC